MEEKNSHLQVEAIKDRFKHSDKITVSDFNDFYREIDDDVNRSTVGWYIHQLNQLGVIRRVSRGQYVLESYKPANNQNKNDEYIVITMDVIQSSKQDSHTFNAELKTKVKSLNQQLDRQYDHGRKFHISQGDELQIIYPFASGLGQVMFLILSHLQPLKVRYGISTGAFHERLTANSWELNGPIFWNARDQIERLKSSHDYDGRIITGYPRTDQICNKILELVNLAITKVTDKQWEAIRAMLTENDIDTILAELAISRSSYSERLNLSGYRTILSSFEAIDELIQLRKEVN